MPECPKCFGPGSADGEDYCSRCDLLGYERYQPLFDHMREQHGLILVESEMQEIERIVAGLNCSMTTERADT